MFTSSYSLKRPWPNPPSAVERMWPQIFKCLVCGLRSVGWRMHGRPFPVYQTSAIRSRKKKCLGFRLFWQRITTFLFGRRLDPSMHSLKPFIFHSIFAHLQITRSTPCSQQTQPYPHTTAMVPIAHAWLGDSIRCLGSLQGRSSQSI